LPVPDLLRSPVPALPHGSSPVPACGVLKPVGGVLKPVGGVPVPACGVLVPVGDRTGLTGHADRSPHRCRPPQTAALGQRTC